MPETTSTIHDRGGAALIRQALTDEDFRRAVLSNPAQVYVEYFAERWPDNVEALGDTASPAHPARPHAASGALPDKAPEPPAGGTASMAPTSRMTASLPFPVAGVTFGAGAVEHS